MALDSTPISSPLSGQFAPGGLGMSGYLDCLRAARSIDEISLLLGKASGELGFAYHALAHHADIARPPGQLLFLQNYPPAWAETYASNRLHRVDPARRLAGNRPGSFAWSEISRFLSLSGQERRMMDEARRAGLGEGFTVPLHAFGERAASCSFATEIGQDLPVAAMLGAEALARAAFSAIFDVTHRGRLQALPRLTPRQLQCIELVAQGKSDWAIGKILSLTQNTITAYLRAAREVLGVSSRTQLAMAALAYGLISVDDVVSWQSPL